MILLIITLVGFYQRAKKHELNAWMWVLFPILAFFGSQVILGVIIGLAQPDLLNDESALTILGLVTGIVALIIMWILMERQAKIKKEGKNTSDGDLLDDNFFNKD